jgi:hypothetical protein
MTPLNPFERYLQHNPQDSESELFQLQCESDDQENNEFSSIQFQIPQFMMFGPPTLAVGGGAEVLPPSMFINTQSDTWLNNNILPNNKAPEQSVHSAFWL